MNINKLAKSDSSILVIARLLAMASILLLVRIGGEEPTGVFAILSSATGMLAFVLALGIPSNYPYFVGVENWSPSKIAGAGFLFTLVSGIFGVVVWLTICPILSSKLFHGTVSLKSLQLGAVCVPLGVFQSHTLGFLQAFNRMRKYALCNFFSLACPAVCSVTLYLASENLDTIIYGFILGSISSSIVCGVCVAKDISFIEIRIPLAKMNRLLIFGLTGYLGGLASLANYRLDRLLIALFAGTSVAGAYAVISRLAELGRILPIAIQTSFAPKAANMSDHAAWNQTKKLLKQVSIFTCIFMTFLVPIGGLVIQILAIQSASWLDLSILCVGVIIAATATPILGYNVASGRPARNTYAAIAGLLGTVILAPILIPKLEIFGACITSAVAYALFGFVLLFLFNRGPDRHLSEQPTRRKLQTTL